KVLVRAQRAPKRSLGKSTVSAKLIKRMPGLAEADVIRSIQGLPGVVSSSDFSTKIYVRGGGSDQNLILIDNAVVYSPVHFFGLFSTFLVEGIDEVNFYKGGFPPEYGNRLSSVLDIRSRKGGKDSVDTWFKGSSLKVSTFASQAHTEGRQGAFRWLLAGRRTYIDQVLEALRGAGLTDLELPYAFYDVQGSAHYDLGGGDGLMVSLYPSPRGLQSDPPGTRAQQHLRDLQAPGHLELPAVVRIHRPGGPSPLFGRGSQLDADDLHCHPARGRFATARLHVLLAQQSLF